MATPKHLATQNSMTPFEDVQHTEWLVKILRMPTNERSPSDVEALVKATHTIKFFKDLMETEQEEGILEQFCLHMMYESYPKDHEVITINTIGDKFYIILSGSVSVHIKQQQDDTSEKPLLKEVAKMNAGLSFGEIALISNRPRLATIICEEFSQFLVLSKKAFDKVLKNKKALNQKLAFVENLPFLYEVNKQYVRDIYSRSVYVTYVNKQPIFNEGDTPEAMYIVIKGCFKATKIFYIDQVQENDQSQKRLQERAIEEFKVKERKRESKSMQITTFSKNEYFGEDDLAEGTKCSYSVVCESVDGELLVIKKNLFMAKVMGDTRGKKYMLQSIEQKRVLQAQKFAQIQISVNRFWKFLKEDRADLKDRIQKQKESNSRAALYRKNNSDNDSHSDEEREDVAPLPRFTSNNNTNNMNSTSTNSNPSSNPSNTSNPKSRLMRRGTVDSLQLTRMNLNRNAGGSTTATAAAVPSFDDFSNSSNGGTIICTSPSPKSKRRVSIESPLFFESMIKLQQQSNNNNNNILPAASAGGGSGEKFPSSRRSDLQSSLLASSSANSVRRATQQMMMQSNMGMFRLFDTQSNLGESMPFQPSSLANIEFTDSAFRRSSLQSAPVSLNGLRRSLILQESPISNFQVGSGSSTGGIPPFLQSQVGGAGVVASSNAITKDLSKIVTAAISAIADEKISGGSSKNISLGLAGQGIAAAAVASTASGVQNSSSSLQASSSSSSNQEPIRFTRSMKKNLSQKMDAILEQTSATFKLQQQQESSQASRKNSQSKGMSQIRQQQQERALLAEQIRQVAGLKEVRQLSSEQQKKLLLSLFEQEQLQQQQIAQQQQQQKLQIQMQQHISSSDLRWRSSNSNSTHQEQHDMRLSDEDQMLADLLKKNYDTREVESSTYEQFKDIFPISNNAENKQEFDMRLLELHESLSSAFKSLRIRNQANSYQNYLKDFKKSHESNSKAYLRIKNKYAKRKADQAQQQQQQQQQQNHHQKTLQVEEEDKELPNFSSKKNYIEGRENTTAIKSISMQALALGTTSPAAEGIPSFVLNSKRNTFNHLSSDALSAQRSPCASPLLSNQLKQAEAAAASDSFQQPQPFSPNTHLQQNLELPSQLNLDDQSSSHLQLQVSPYLEIKTPNQLSSPRRPQTAAATVDQPTNQSSNPQSYPITVRTHSYLQLQHEMNNSNTSSTPGIKSQQYLRPVTAFQTFQASQPPSSSSSMSLLDHRKYSHMLNPTTEKEQQQLEIAAPSSHEQSPGAQFFSRSASKINIQYHSNIMTQKNTWLPQQQSTQQLQQQVAMMNSMTTTATPSTPMSNPAGRNNDLQDIQQQQQQQQHQLQNEVAKGEQYALVGDGSGRIHSQLKKGKAMQRVLRRYNCTSQKSINASGILASFSSTSNLSSVPPPTVTSAPAVRQAVGEGIAQKQSNGVIMQAPKPSARYNPSLVSTIGSFASLDTFSAIIQKGRASNEVSRHAYALQHPPSSNNIQINQNEARVTSPLLTSQNSCRQIEMQSQSTLNSPEKRLISTAPIMSSTPATTTSSSARKLGTKSTTSLFLSTRKNYLKSQVFKGRTSGESGLFPFNEDRLKYQAEISQKKTTLSMPDLPDFDGETPAKTENLEEEVLLQSNYLSVRKAEFVLSPIPKRTTLNNSVSSSSAINRVSSSLNIITKTSGNSIHATAAPQSVAPSTNAITGANLQQASSTYQPQKTMMRPFTAVSKAKSCSNSFFNTINANNFVKSAQIKRKRLLEEESNRLARSAVTLRPKTSHSQKSLVLSPN